MTPRHYIVTKFHPTKHRLTRGQPTLERRETEMIKRQFETQYQEEETKNKKIKLNLKKFISQRTKG